MCLILGLALIFGVADGQEPACRGYILAAEKGLMPSLFQVPVILHDTDDGEFQAPRLYGENIGGREAGYLAKIPKEVIASFNCSAGETGVSIDPCGVLERQLVVRDYPYFVSYDGGGGSTFIPYENASPRGSRSQFHLNLLQDEFRRLFQEEGGMRDFIGLASFLQGSLRLPEGVENQANADEGQYGADGANQVGLVRGIRRFFSRDGGAPLSAQIGGVVVFGLITGVGVIAGIGGVIRRRLSGWAYLLGGLSTYGLFLWWSSPAYS